MVRLPRLVTNRRSGSRRGFTLLELMIVVAVVVVMSGATAVFLPRFRADALLNAAIELQSALSVTRETAIAMRTPLSVTLNVAGNSVSYAKPGGQAMTLQFGGGIGYPAYLGDGSMSNISVYANYEANSALHYNKDWYVSSTAKGTSLPQVWFDAFGRPNVEVLPLGTPDLAGVESGYGFVTLEVRGGGSIVQVLVHANTGETEVRWVKR